MSVTLTGAGKTVVLPSPEFDDTLKVEHLRVNAESRAGTRIIFRDPDWPITQTLEYKFTDLSQYLAWNMLDFIQATLGINITLVDYTGKTWIGIILNPDAAIEQYSPNFNDFNCGGFSIELKFEGVEA